MAPRAGGSEALVWQYNIDMKLGGLILFTLGVLPGQAPDGRPAASTVRGKIHSDRRVTFRVQAPSAKQVAVAGRAADSGMNGNTPYEMKRGEGGVWQVTTGPVRPGFHYYELIIDGIHTIDPSSETYFGWAQSTSGLEVPDESLDFYSVKDVPHGEVRIHWYHSKTTADLGWNQAHLDGRRRVARVAGVAEAPLRLRPASVSTEALRGMLK
jgi:hypothetical protein